MSILRETGTSVIMHGKEYSFLKKKKNVGESHWTATIAVLGGEDIGR